MTPLQANFSAYVHALSLKKREPDWLLKLRLIGLRHYFATAETHPEIDAYLDRISTNHNSILDENPLQDAATAAEYRWFVKALAAKGVIYCRLHDALCRHGALVKAHLASVVAVEQSKMSAINQAFWDDGLFIYVPSGVEVDLPMQPFLANEQKGSSTFLRYLIILEEGASAEYVEGCASRAVDDRHSLSLPVVEIKIARGARFDYVVMQDGSKRQLNLGVRAAWLGRRARIDWHESNIAMGSSGAPLSLITLGEDGANARMNVIMAGEIGYKQSFSGKIQHHAPNCESTLVVRLLGKEGGEVVFTGGIEVDEKIASGSAKLEVTGLISPGDGANIKHQPTLKLTEQLTEFIHTFNLQTPRISQRDFLRRKGFNDNAIAELMLDAFVSPVAEGFPLEFRLELRHLLRN